MKQLSHNGVLVPKYEARGFSIAVKGKRMQLTAEQEEMAVAWIKKLGTDYVNDKVFEKNFFDDFGRALGIKEKISAADVDFSEIKRAVEKERNEKLSMTREQKKKLAEERKKLRDANKEKYGYVTVDGERVEVSNYLAEPSSIFMGRGQHPLRGKWKQGAKESDIILNLSPDSKVPPGNWKQIVWEKDFMWIAKWDDKLRGKEKYVWLADTCRIKQEREIEKFDKARELEKYYEKIKQHINNNLAADDIKRRKIATVCYLIDELQMRVGDEKDEDEADTVGATTLTKNNVIIKPNNVVKFDFLGKDSVRWEKELQMPEQVVKNLREFIASSILIFDGVRSENVKLFLNEVMPGLTSKVFRTFHASKTVDNYFRASSSKKDDSEENKKYFATMANLQAAVVCNHKRKLPKNWEQTLQKKIDRLKQLKEKIEARRQKNIATFEAKIKKLELMKQTEKKTQQLKQYKTKLKSLQKNKMTERDEEKIKKAELKMEIMKQTKDYNLNTSLKSYIDPRVYFDWAKKIGFDWKKYYSKTLQRKFSWIEEK